MVNNSTPRETVLNVISLFIRNFGQIKNSSSTHACQTMAGLQSIPWKHPWGAINCERKDKKIEVRRKLPRSPFDKKRVSGNNYVIKTLIFCLYTIEIKQDTVIFSLHVLFSHRSFFLPTRSNPFIVLNMPLTLKWIMHCVEYSDAWPKKHTTFYVHS